MLDTRYDLKLVKKKRVKKNVLYRGKGGAWACVGKSLWPQHTDHKEAWWELQLDRQGWATSTPVVYSFCSEQWEKTEGQLHDLVCIFTKIKRLDQSHSGADKTEETASRGAPNKRWCNWGQTSYDKSED